VNILGISGSLRQESYNTTLLRAAADLLPPGAKLTLYDRLEEIPPFNEDRVAARPEPVARLWDAVAEADGVLISTPEYNSSIPGVLKNALDWLSRPLIESPLRNKPVAVIGASTSMFGAVWSQAETRKVLGAIGARVLDRELPLPSADEQFDEEGTLVERDLELELGTVVHGLGQMVEERTSALAARLGRAA
jgi:chromate reductase, NAD(P)H dehydrogenase (quinone)